MSSEERFRTTEPWQARILEAIARDDRDDVIACYRCAATVTVPAYLTATQAWRWADWWRGFHPCEGRP